MRTFKDAVQNIYLPSYKELYDLKKSDSKKYIHHKLNFIVGSILDRDDTVYALDLLDILKKTYSIKSTATRVTIDKALYSVLYALAELLGFYNENNVGARIENRDIKLGNHYSANVDRF